MTSFPNVRMRRLRRSPALRALVRETRLTPDRFLAPLFVRHGKGLREEISSLPGVFRLSPDEAVAAAQEIRSWKIPGVILFGIPEKKDETGSEAWADEAAVQTTVRRLEKEGPALRGATAVCLGEWTCLGPPRASRDWGGDNQATVTSVSRP